MKTFYETRYMIERYEEETICTVHRTLKAAKRLAGVENRNVCAAIRIVKVTEVVPYPRRRKK